MDSHVVGFGTDTPACDEVKNQKNKKSNKKSGGFQSLGLSFPVFKGLQKRGYKIPTPIQRKSIPLILEGRDVVAMARTGSGKTACFLVPMLEKLKERSAMKNNGPGALILSPTRELALQTLRFIHELGKFMNFKSIAVLGGDSMDQQFGAIHANPDIVVATPGRFLHLCVEMDLKLSSVEYVVFDEADRLFEQGFGEQLKDIIDRLPENRQTLLFSATLPKLLVDFAKAGLNDPVLLRLDVDSKLPDTLELAYFSVRSEDKPAALICVLQKLPKKAQTLVFAATKHHVEYLHLLLDKAGVSNTFIYSDLDPSARKINAAKFVNGNCSVLIVTDVAARGMDIPKLDYVINYHFPAKAKLFVHRVGRCARAGRSGTAFSLVSAEEGAYVFDLHLFLGRPLNLISTSEKIDDKSKDGAFGIIPDALIENEQSEILAWHKVSVDMSNMRNVCKNAYGRYLTSRPGASVESVRRLKETNLINLAVHPFFGSAGSNERKVFDLLSKMKNYKPKGTIFELNVSAKSNSYSIMKVTKKAHKQQIENFKRKQVERAENSVPVDKTTKPVNLKASNENEIHEAFKSVIGGKRKRKSENGTSTKKHFKDEENYIPHHAPDRHTEEGLAMDSFTLQASNAAFDITGDSAETLKLQKRIKRWDATKKKMVGAQDEKVKKIQTESGNWIPATYKSNRYAQWKEKSKVSENQDESEDDSEKEDNQTMKFKRRDLPNTHWGKHNRKVAEKLKKKATLKRPEQILKARKIRDKKRQKSIPNKNRTWNRNNTARR